MSDSGGIWECSLDGGKLRFRETARDTPVIVQGRGGGHSWMGLRDRKKNKRWPELRMDWL